MRKRYLAVVVALAVILCGIGGSVAYFTAKDTGDNVFTVGKVKIELTEDQWNEDADHVIGAGASFAKNPVVTNVGDNPCYVRMHVVVSEQAALTLAAGDPVKLLTGLPGSGWQQVGEAAIDPAKGTATYTFVYTPVLEVGAKTPALFTAVTFPGALDQAGLDQMDGKFDITISADAIQSEGFADVTEAFQAFDGQ